MSNSQVPNDYPTQSFARGSDAENWSTISQTGTGPRQSEAESMTGATGWDRGSDGSDNFSRTGSTGAGGANAFNSDRPMNTKPAPQGGVAIDGGNNDMPMGKANILDKAIGKLEKVAGKYGKKPELHERGELRESGGAAAAKGQARAPHD